MKTIKAILVSVILMSLIVDVRCQYRKKDKDYYHNLGDKYYFKGEYDKAISYFNKSLKINPKNPKTYNNLGVIYQDHKKQYWKAVENYKKAIQIDPKFDLAFNNLGYSFQWLGDLNKAEENYKKALSLNPKYLIAYGNLEGLYQKQKMFDKLAELKGQKMKELNVGSSFEYAELGVAYLKANKIEKSIESFEKSNDISPNADTYYNLGRIYFGHFEDTTNGRLNFQKTIELDSSYTKAYIEIGNIYLKMNNPVKAIPYYEKGLRLDTTKTQLYNNLGYAYASQKNYQKAIACYQKAIQIDSSYKNAYINLSKLHLSLKEYNTTVKILEKCISLDKRDPRPYYIFAQTHATQNQPEEALRFLAISMELGLYDPESIQKDPFFESLINLPQFIDLFKNQSNR